jgi:hypothetical protein
VIRCSSTFPSYGRIRTTRCVAKGRIKRSDTWAGEGSRSVSQSEQEMASHCRLSKSVSFPIADVFEEGSQHPMLCHIVTRSRQLLRK